MKRLVAPLALAVALACGGVHAGPFDAVGVVQDQLEAEAKAKAMRQAAERKAAEQRRQAAIAAANKRKAQQQAAVAAEAARRQARAEAQEDEERAIMLESAMLDNDAKRARVKRVDEYIDRELDREDARTDVVQSRADLTRAKGDNIRAQGEAAKSIGRGIEKGLENCSKKTFGSC